MKKLKPGSRSSRLNDATIESVNLLKRRPDSRRKILLLIAESRDNGSELKAREVLSAAEFADVVIYAIDISKFVASITAPPSANRNILDTRPPGAVYAQGPTGGVQTPTTISQNNMGNWTPVIKDICDLTKGIFIPPPLEVYHELQRWPAICFQVAAGTGTRRLRPGRGTAQPIPADL